MKRHSLFGWISLAKSNEEVNVKPPKRSLQGLFQQTKVTSHPPLPSGLSIEQAADIATAFATSLRRLHRQGKTLSPTITAYDITVIEQDQNLRLEFPEQDGVQDEQIVLSRVFAYLVTGQDKLDIPDNKYPQTAKVLEMARQNQYNSVTELAGAFGWSLYRQEQIRQMPLEQPKNILNKWLMRLEQPHEIVLPSPKADKAPVNSSIAFVSLAVAMLLICGFVVYSVLTSPINDELATNQSEDFLTPIATPTPTSLPTLLITRTNDGAQLTRFNAAQASEGESAYTPPDQLPIGAVAALTGKRPTQITGLQWADDQTLNLALQDGGWEKWDTLSKNRIVRRELPNADQYVQISWSPNGENFAGVSFDAQLKLGSNGRVLKSMPLNTSAYGYGYTWRLYYANLQNFSWSPDGSYMLFNSFNGILQLWNFKDGVRQITTQDTDSLPSVNSYSGGNRLANWAWSGDNRYLATFSGGLPATLKIFETATVSLAYTIDLSERETDQNGQALLLLFADEQRSVAPRLDWSPDGKFISVVRWATQTSTNSKPQVSIIELPKLGLPLDTLLLKPTKLDFMKLDLVLPNINNANLVSWSKDNRLVVSFERYATRKLEGNDLFIFKKNETGWQSQAPIKVNQKYLQIIRWSNDAQRIFVNGSDGSMTFYDPSGAAKPEVIVAGVGLQQYALAPSPDGQLLAGFDNDNNLVVSDIRNNQVLFRRNAPVGIESPTGYIKWSADNQFLLTLYSGPRSVDLPTNSRLSDSDTLVQLWKFEKGDLILANEALLPFDNRYNFDISWNNESSKPQILFELNARGEIALLDLSEPLPPLETQREWKSKVVRLSLADELPTDLPYKIVAKLATELSRQDRSLRIWLPDWKAVITTLNNNSAIGIVKLAKPDVRTSEKPVAIFEPNPLDTNTVDPTADGKMIAFGFSNGLLNVYNGQTGELIRSFTAHQGSSIVKVKFSPDGQYLMSSGTDKVVKIWDTSSWKLTNTLRVHSAPIIEAKWLNDSKSLITVSLINNTYSAFVWRVK